MKTPRELLFARHQGVETKLDDLREKVLADLRVEQGSVARRSPASEMRARVVSPQFKSNIRPAWIERLLSFRWHFAGLSAAWLLILALNVEPSSVSYPNLALESALSSRQLLLALRENRRQVLELTVVPATDPATTRPATAPARRGQAQSENRTA